MSCSLNNINLNTKHYTHNYSIVHAYTHPFTYNRL